jgi:uncharacterized protein (DUF58 family)
MKEIIAKIKKYEIRIRKAVNTQMKGDYHSVFKGSGLQFDDIRQYDYGDDVRTVNWNVSAKGDGIYVNTYKEEKEQNVFFILDVSGSQEIGQPGSKKIDMAKEICAVLALSAVKEGSSVGFLSFSDKKEKFVKPNKGVKHSYNILKGIFEHEPLSAKTNITRAVALTLNMVKRKSVIVLISDFIDEGYEVLLKAMAKRHDLIILHISDNREKEIPPLGIIEFFDVENKRNVWINTSSERSREKLLNNYRLRGEKISKLCRTVNANYLFLNTGEDYVVEKNGEYPSYLAKIVKLFKVRNINK